MNFEFDPAKDALNIAHRGLSLAFGAIVFEDDEHIVVPTHRPMDSEDQ